MPIDPRALAPQLRELLRRSRRARWAALALGALVFYTLCGFLLVPALLAHYVPQGVRDALGCELALGKVRFNPFTWQLNIDDATLVEADGKPVFAAARLRANFQLSSLFRRAWTFAEVRLERPVLEFVIEADGRTNLARLATPPPGAEAPADDAAAPSPRFVLQRISLKDGTLRLVDSTLEKPARTEIRAIELRAEQLGSVPDSIGGFRFAAQLPGHGVLAANGSARLDTNNAGLELSLSGLEPGALWDFAAAQLRLAPPAGSIDVHARIELVLTGAEPAWRIEDLGVSLHDVKLALKDDARALELASLELAGGRIDSATRSVTIASLALHDGHFAAQLDESGVIDWSAILVPASSAAAPEPAPTWRIALPAIELARIGVHLRDASRTSALRIAADALGLRAAAELEIGAAQPVFRVHDANLDLAVVRLDTADGAEPLAHLVSVAAEGIDIDSATARVQLERLALAGLATGIERRADGTLRELDALASRAPTPATADSSAPPWQVGVTEIALTGIAATVTDRQTEPALRYTVADGALSVRDFDTASSEPLAIEVKLPLAEGGEIAAKGTAAPDGTSADLELDLHELALQPLAPLVARETILQLADGTLSADTEIHYRKGEWDQLQMKGTVTVAQLQLNEAASGAPFMAWKSLKAKGIELGLGPDRLAIEDIRIVDPAAKIVFDAERNLNLTQLRRNAPAQPAANGATAEFPVAIERVRIKNGTVDFADYSLVLPFAAHIERFAGVARHVSTQPDSRTTLALTGRVGAQGEARVEGSLAPFAPSTFSDVTVSFRDIPTSTLSPYSATFAGRTITRGDLDLDLEYKVDEGRLAGGNRIVLQDFELGEQVQSEQAMHLPLDLAIALLSDSDGRIDLEVPISGNVGDPQFSYGGLVWKALGNALTGIVAAPFRALGSLLGGEADENMGSVRFAAGSSDLAPRETVRLGELASALAARPKLGITVRPAVEDELDGKALRNAAIRREVAQQLEVELAEDEEPGPIAADDAKTQRALEGIAEERHGEQWLETIASEFTTENGKPPERVVKALALIGRGGGERAFYQLLFERLVAAEPVPSEALAKLASERADVVARELGKKGFAAERLVVGEPGEPAKTDEKRRTVSIALELGPLGVPSVAQSGTSD